MHNQTEESLVTLARALLSARRVRDRSMPDAGFSDPAWDMLLDLFVAHHDARNVSVSSLCVAAYVPQTTALRWVASLSRKGYLTRSADGDDRRVIRIGLSEIGLARMASCLSQFVPLFADPGEETRYRPGSYGTRPSSGFAAR